MTVYPQLEQGSDEWLAIRRGRATASEFSNILTPTGKLSKSSEAYMVQLATECIVDNPQGFAGNKATDWGHDHEEEARRAFTAETGLVTEEVGFCISDFSPLVGNSPDALIRGEDGEYCSGLEIKCPYNVNNHVSYLLAGEVPAKYKLQVHGSMVVAGFDSWHFMSYFPGLRPLIIKVERDEFTAKVENALKAFAEEYGVQRAQIIDKITY